MGNVNLEYMGTPPMIYMQGNGERFLQISLHITGLRVWSLETCVAGWVGCCLSWFVMVSGLLEETLICVLFVI